MEKEKVKQKEKETEANLPCGSADYPASPSELVQVGRHRLPDHREHEPLHRRLLHPPEQGTKLQVEVLAPGDHHHGAAPRPPFVVLEGGQGGGEAAGQAALGVLALPAGEPPV